MSTYTGILFLHIAAAVLLLGTSIVGEPVVRAAARRADRAGEVSTFLSIGHRMTTISPPAALLVLISGVYLTTVGRNWTLGWIQVSVALWLINSFVAAVVVKSATQQVSEEADAAPEAPVGPGLDRLRWAGGWTWGGDLLAVNDAVMLYVMVIKPTLAGSVTTLILAWMLVAVIRIALGLHRPPRREDGHRVGAAA